jgi:hypothetical protein
MGQCCTKRENEINKFKDIIEFIPKKKLQYKIEKYKNQITEQRNNAIINAGGCVILVGIIISGGFSLPIFITLILTGGTCNYFIINMDKNITKLKLLEDIKN